MTQVQQQQMRNWARSMPTPEQTAKKFAAISKRIAKDPELGRRLLIQAGIMTLTGKIKPAFR